MEHVCFGPFKDIFQKKCKQLVLNFFVCEMQGNDIRKLRGDFEPMLCSPGQSNMTETLGCAVLTRNIVTGIS